MECLTCKRPGQKLFYINSCFGDGQNTIKDDIIEFVGDSIIDRLDDNQLVCDVCKNMFDDIVRSKYKVLKAILAQKEQKYIPNLGRFWTFIARSCQQNKFEQNAYGDVTNLSPGPRGTPLVFINRTQVYDEKIEKDVETLEGMKSDIKRYNGIAGSRPSIRVNRRANTKAARSASADVKRIKSRVIKSAQSERPYRSVSELSFLSCTEEDEGRRKTAKDSDVHRGPALVFDGDEIVYPVKRTRYVTHSHERYLQEKQEKKEEVERKKLFKCSYPSCKNMDFGTNLSFFTSHLVEIHSCIPHYKCWTCGNSFVSSPHLKHHLKNHDVQAVFCGICGMHQRNVSTYQKHIDQHLESSVKCFLCDMAFLTKRECNKHIFSNHRRRKSYDMKMYKVLKKVNYAKPNVGEAANTSSNDKEKQYSSVVMNVTSTSEPVVFRGRSYPELDYLQRKRKAEPEVDEFTTDEPKVTSLGDDLNFNTDLVESVPLIRKTPVTPNSIFREDDLTSLSYSPARRKRRWTSYQDSVRPITPFEGLNIPSDDEALDFDLRTFDRLSRDLESRNTEVADIFAGESEADVDYVRGGAKSSASCSQVDESRAMEGDSDVDSETHYLDKDNFVSSINCNDIDSTSERS